jgi:hypothetical protein
MDIVRFEIPEEKFEIAEKYKMRFSVLLLGISIFPLTLWIASKVEFKFLSLLIFFIGGLLSLVVIMLSPRRKNLGTLTFKPEGIFIQCNDKSEMFNFSEIAFMEYNMGEKGFFGSDLSHILAIKFNDCTVVQYYLKPKSTEGPILKQTDLLLQILHEIKNQNYSFVRLSY